MINSGGNSQPQEKNHRPQSKQNFIGVPPELTETSRKTGEGGEFVDEEEEEEAQNNIIT